MLERIKRTGNDSFIWPIMSLFLVISYLLETLIGLIGSGLFFWSLPNKNKAENHCDWAEAAQW